MNRRLINFPRRAMQLVHQQVHYRVAALVYQHGRSQHIQPDKTVSGSLFGPGDGTPEYIAARHLKSRAAKQDYH